MKKKNNKILIIAGLVVALLILNYLGVFKQTLTTVVINESQSPSPYICPSGISYCEVTPTMECNQLTGNQEKVIFRYDGSYGVGHDFALSLYGSELKSYTFDNQLSNAKCGTDKDSYLFSKNGEIHFGNQVFVCYVDNRGNFVAKTYKTGGLADVSPTPKNSILEITTGSSGYSCTGEIKINNLLKDSLTYSKSVPGSLSRSYNIYPGDTVSISGGDKRYILYRNLEVFQGCTKSTCNEQKNGYYNCTNERLETALNFCDTNYGFVCEDTYTGAVCKPPFSANSLTTTKPGYTTGESIIANINLYSSNPEINNGIVTVYLWDQTDTSDISKSIGNHPINFNFKSNEIYQLIIPNNLAPKKYYLTMTVNYNGKILNLNSKPYFNVAPTVTQTLEIKGKDRPSAYVNNPVLVNVITPIEVDSVNLNVLFNNFPLNIPNPSITKSGDFIVYSYEFLFATSGTLEATATVIKSGVSSQSSYSSKDIRDLKVYAEFTNLIDCVTPNTEKTFYFETKVLDEFVDTNNILTVSEPLSTSKKDISGLITKNDDGKYQFTYKFTTKGGYGFNLVSTSPSYNVGSEPITPQIEVRDNCDPVECVSIQDCSYKGVGYTCSGGKCVTSDNPTTKWGLIIGLLIFGIIILVIVIYYVKRKKSTPNLGFGNL